MTDNNLLTLIEALLEDAAKYVNTDNPKLKMEASVAQGVLLGFALAEANAEYVVSANTDRTVKDEAQEIVAAAMSEPPLTFVVSNESEAVH